MKEVTLKAHAKVNLSLDLVARYPADHELSGFTQIETVLLRLALHDLVKVEMLESANRKISIVADDKSLPQSSNGKAKDNVCYKAVTALHTFIPDLPENDLQITITKRIPLAAGLGGSSTDGAVVLLALNKLYNLALDKNALKQLAASFGSDTVFFVSEASLAVATGKGDEVKTLPLEMPDFHLVILHPAIELKAGDVYKSFSPDFFLSVSRESVTQALISALQKDTKIDNWHELIKNDLEQSPLVKKEIASLCEIKQSFIDNGALATLMSGSGSSIVGLCKDEETATTVATAMKNCYPEYNSFMTTPF
jgi:4-diphosphocytidyl-2-C-methyl-D-erythritol kinase